MTTGKVREFNRLYKNLQEVCNRIYDDENNYPKKACADWFLNDLQTLIGDSDLITLLDIDKINLILEMSANIRRNDYLHNQSKNRITALMRELKTIRTKLADENNVVVDIKL